ncbi:hypothetical protein LINPERPRIM_LOCUS37124 [Linum perenne]
MAGTLHYLRIFSPTSLSSSHPSHHFLTTPSSFTAKDQRGRRCAPQCRWLFGMGPPKFSRVILRVVGTTYPGRYRR